MEQQAPQNQFQVDALVHALADSLQTIEWAVSLLPEGWHHRSPGGGVAGLPADSWSVAMNLAHMTMYEERVALPMIEALAAGDDGCAAVPSSREKMFFDDAQALSHAPVGHILYRLRAARRRQIRVAYGFSHDRLNMPITPAWGERYGAAYHSPGWVLAKTLQHTWEHGNSILRIALFAPQ